MRRVLFWFVLTLLAGFIWVGLALPAGIPKSIPPPKTGHVPAKKQPIEPKPRPEIRHFHATSPQTPRGRTCEEARSQDRWADLPCVRDAK